MLDLIYGFAVQLRNAAYSQGLFRREQASIPVISIGNVQVGGTGKTPLAAWAMEVLAEAGFRVAYLSRGYGRKSQGFKKVRLDGDWEAFGDEAVLIANRFPKHPVGVCEDRAEGVNMLAEVWNAEVVVLDDAFQHRRLRRNLDIVTIDVARDWEQDKLLPLGRLREPWSSLRRSDWIIGSKLDAASDVASLSTRLAQWDKPLAFSRPRLKSPVQISGPAMGTNRNVVSFSGLGNNEAFAHNLRAGPWTVLEHIAFPDHHPYSRRDLLHIRSRWQVAADTKRMEPPMLLTTEKDYFRIRNVQYTKEWHDIPFAYVPMELEWLAGEKALAEALIKTAHE
jgi:tetraacyldisaccharide 4'-kinase